MKTLKTIAMALVAVILVICLAGIVSAKEGPGTAETPVAGPAVNHFPYFFPIYALVFGV